MDVIAIVGFILLALVLVWAIGLPGMVIWLVVYGLFRAIARWLLAIVGDGPVRY